MFDEDQPNEDPAEKALDPARRAAEKADEFRMHAELAAVFEGPRKFDARIRPSLNADLARQLQKSFGKLEKSKTPDSPVLPPPSVQEAADVLNTAQVNELETNDYYIYRRPGEVMIVRWLAGEQVETFYERFQAHFEAGLDGYREEQRHEQQWKQDPDTLAFLEKLDAIDLKMTDRYLREPIRTHKLFVLSTQTADEMNIAYLSDHIMGVSPAEIVGPASAPPDEPGEADLAWFFKLFSLRGTIEGEERMCFFTYLQKSDDSF